MKKNKMVALSIPSWILEDVLGDTSNRSARILELVIKGHLYEKEKKNKRNSGAFVSSIKGTIEKFTTFLRLSLKSPQQIGLIYNCFWGK